MAELFAKGRVESRETAEAAGEGDFGDALLGLREQLMRVGDAGIGDEGDEGLAGVLEELAAESGAAHGTAFHGSFERERFGELFEHPLHHRFETWAGGGIGFGEDMVQAERDGVFLRRAVE